MKPWKNRIVAYGEESPETLVANPKNWRVHPDSQKAALAGVLDDVGVVAPVIVNRTTGFVIDGHLRVALAISNRQSTVPVCYVELSEAMEAEVLATFDPIAGLAVPDLQALDEVLRSFDTGNESVMAMLDDLARNVGIVSSGEEFKKSLGALPDGDRQPLQEMTFIVSDRQAETIRQALSRAKGDGMIPDEANANGNGNALAHIAEAYLG